MDAPADIPAEPSAAPAPGSTAATDRAAVRRRSLLVGTVAAVAAIAAATGVALVAASASDDETALPEPEAEIRFLPEDDESASPLLAEDNTGEAAPDTSFPLLGGGLGSLADVAGRPAVVNLFASWCAPCEAELPDFATVRAEVGDEVAFVGINVRDSEDDAQRLLDDTGMTFDLVARDPSGTLSEELGVVNMPSTFFLDADGRIVASVPGTLSADELRAEIAALR